MAGQEKEGGTSNIKDKEIEDIDVYPETFPDFKQLKIASPAQATEGSHPREAATSSEYREPTAQEIEAAIRRANSYQNNPLTNTVRRSRPTGDRARNRSAAVSFQVPSVPPGATPINFGAHHPTSPQQVPVASERATPASVRGRGIPVPGRSGYIPTLPPLNNPPRRQLRDPNSGRPVVVGGFDNPLDEYNQRVLRRKAHDQRTLESFLQNSSPESTWNSQNPRPLPELPPASTAQQSTAAAPSRAAHHTPPTLPAQNSAPPHPSPLQSHPVALNQQEPFTTPSRRRARSASFSTPSNASSLAFYGPTQNQPPPETIQEEPSTEHEELDHSEEPDIRTAQIGRSIQQSNESSHVSLRGGSLDLDDFSEDFDPSYYESDDIDDDLAVYYTEFNPNISEDFNPYDIEATSQVHTQILEKMASHIPRPGPAKLSPNAGLDEWLEEAKQCHYLPERAMKELCELVKEVLMEESNIQPVCTPVTICGDIHGQFYDLLELFRVAGGMPGESNVEAPKTATTVISPEDIEPPTEITNPKLKKKVRNAGSPPADEDDEDDAAAADTSATSRADSAVEVSTTSQSADTRFIFLGDFVDRGYFSLETFTLLMCLKAKYPDRIVLVRGNHESRQITQVYGFYEECQQKYGNASVWKACCHVFDFLVLAAIVDGELLCVHGGLSPEIRTIDQIRVVARAQEIPHEGAFCDLVWSDPEDVETWAISPRGAGWLFGDKVATEFNHVNGLKLIARAHQLVNEGYKYHFPQNSVVTVWSAPNYCYRCGNVASIMTVDKDMNPKFSIFSAVPDEQRHVPANRRGPGDYFL
ncbi:calcineurin-like phosphoesterase [Colletotrichum scovillei]|uniref:Serine/threonine-protein phosphatase n=1 Tax=Colletotrichum scovillei TaxID=1209932 RepID=A0A9P7RAN6_9PEZI|nr:calcineurin-like phosphoesterase [Colletotrichum scovillei]KAF4776610.1 calcineurin-like phosphoesterase [Colletotrichum scovillei]KAG7053886.1 protein phosphatase [Colletotrichum scovillei]KAG7072182.1 protein phosphatase [Colletotrichum scovillei]KAG7080333.1 protein phosphatase [Colletotrichum scovillei]